MPTSLCENPIRSSQKKSVTDLRYLIVIWDVMFFLWLSTNTVFTGVYYDVPGYDSSLVMISSQTSTGQRCFPVRHWVTVSFLIPIFCVRNVGDTLSARCMQMLLCGNSCRFMYNPIPPFHRMRVFLFYHLGVVEYSHDHMPNKQATANSCPMDVLIWEWYFLKMWNTSLSGIAFWYFVGGYTDL